jgi:uncharacterized membrane protein
MNKIFLLFVLIFSFIFPQNGFAQEDLAGQNVETATGVVMKVLSESNNPLLEDTFGEKQKTQKVQIKITSGTLKGKDFTVENQLTLNPAYDIDVKKGDRVVLDIEKNGNTYIAYISDRERIPFLLVITGLFFLSILLVGKSKGLNALISILITALLIFFILIPGILKGFSPVLLTVVIAVISTVATMFTVGGFNIKSLSASIGSVLSLILSGTLSMTAIKTANLSGLSGQDSLILWATRPDLDFTGILTSAMIIAALGAIMDIGMSIASCINELKTANGSLGTKELIKSGMNVGKDIIGTMSNTLILAYLGSAFPLLLLASNVSLIKFLNLNTVATEIAAALTGSIGIVLCVPITAVVTAYLIQNKYAKDE